MKKILIPISAIFVAGFSKAQLTNTENYVYSKTYLDYNGATANKTSETVQYFDGLGRPKQVVNVKASPQGKDVVTHIEYDGFGRQVKDYLPVPQAGTMNGAIVPNPLANATQPTIYGSEKIYTEKILENSPLDRVFEQKQVGNAWNNKPVKMEYDANSVADAVKKYTTTTTWVSGATNSVLTQTANYGLAQLYKNTVIDEDGNKTIEFKNGKGQTLLVRKNDGSKDADTYYVYNEYNQLAYVIPPLASNSALSSTVLNSLCYQYRYDGRNRLVEKKLPGKGWEFMIYDKQDRLVSSKDSQNPWLFTKYDKFGRVIYTGVADLGSRSAAQTNLDNLSGTAAPNNEAKNTSSFNHSGMDIYYSNSAFPTNIIKILSVNYYDTYPTGTPAIPVEILGKPILPQDSQNSNISTKSLPTASYVKNIENDNWTMNYTWYDTKGRAIGSHSVNHLGGFTKTESELDFAGVMKKTNTYHSRSSQSTEVTVQENFTYDSQNRLLTHTHQVNANPVEILAENTYNELGQLINKRIGSGLQSAEYDYNIRGWMTGINKKKLIPNGMDGKLFAYDIRYENPTSSSVSPAKFNGNISEVNWMVSSNQNHKRYAYNYDQLNRLTAATFLNPNSTTPLNHMNDEIVKYDLNGNITHLTRNAVPFSGTTPDMIDDLYYTYNGNQLVQVKDESYNPTGYEGGGGWIDYDANGNMLNMQDKQINQIGYNFLNLPNALKIEDSKKKLFHLYRADGSKLKKIFNYLKDDGNTFTTVTEYLDGFQYLTTMGTKPNDIDPMEYAYEQEAFIEQILEEEPIAALQFFPTAEGFYDYENNQYIYQYKDHLGNVRVSYKKGVNGLAEITDQNDYYPFGMNIPREGKAIFGVASLYNFKYSGKELQETSFYDYGWRQYMPDIGRWLQMDPLAERDRRWSPYRYAYDNPLRFIDPDGLWELEIKQREIMKKGQGTGKFENYLAFVAQEGDNINTLAEQTGLDLDQLQKGLEGVEIKEGSSLDKLGIASADKMIGTINKYINDQRKAFDSNCWGTSVSMGRRGSVDFNVDGKNTGTIPDPNRADEILQDEFKQTNNPSFGDLRRYAYSDGNKRLSKEFNDYGYNIVDSGNKAGGTSHYATYLLNNGAGTVYVFSKNGAGANGKWVVTPERHITGDNGYGNPTPIGSGSPNYTKK